jgi:hypothetical protein
MTVRSNASVGLEQLSPQVPVGFNAPVVWTTGGTVFQGSRFYQCETTHTSGVFATDPPLASGN